MPSHPSQQEEPGSAPNSVQPVIDTEPAGADQPATESVLQDNNGRASDQQEEPGSAPNSVQPVIDTEPAGADQPATESVLQDNNGRASDQQETSGRTSANDLLEEDKKDRKQRRMHRRILFYTVLLIVIGSIGALSVLIYIVALRNEGAKVSDGVLIAFISASAIQAFALLSIFARSLFPALPILPSKREAKEEE